MTTRGSMRAHGVAGALLLALFAVPGCGGGGEQGATSPPAAPVEAAEPEEPAEPIPLAEAQQIFASRCSSCHGNDGRGDGPAAVSLVPKPRNLQDPAWQSGVTDQQIEQTIAYGGAAVGKSAIMPGHPDLANQPAVLAGLVNYVRSLKD